MGKKSKARTKTGSARKSACSDGGNNRGKQRQADPFGTEPSAAARPKGESIYQIYKTATLRFKGALSDLVPAAVFENGDVQSFLDAADYVKDNALSVSESLLRDLRLAISVRKKYSRRLADGGDEGHAYFLLVLNYCLQVLKRCVVACDESKAKSGDAVEEDENKQQEEDAFLNRFGALSMEDYLGDEDNSDDEDDDDGDAPISRPETPNGHFSFDDLMSFPDKAKCEFFFDTMAFHVRKFQVGLRNIKETLRMEAAGDYPSQNVSTEVLCLGTVANMMMLDVQKAENELYVECPHLAESPYRVLAVTFLSALIALVSQNVQKQSPLAKKWKHEMAVAFVGDIVEAVFLCRYDEPGKISERFSRRWKLPEHWRGKNVWLANLIRTMTFGNVKTVTEAEVLSHCSIEDEFDEYLSKAPKWMEDNRWWSAFIGGEQSILNTWKLLDMHGSSLNNGDKEKHVYHYVMADLMNRNQWDADSNPASTIRGDMDSVLVKLLLHMWESKWRIDGRAVPMEKKLLPIVSYVRQWMMGFDSRKPTFALIFAVHLLLMSLFELQGDGDVARVGSIGKAAFNRFTSQCEQRMKLDIPCSPQTKHCLEFIIDTKRVIEPTGDPLGLEEMPGFVNYDVLFWNPLCCGLFLGYVQIYLQLEGGLTAMSIGNETRAVLHMYNALRVRGLVQEDLPLLSDIDASCRQLKFVWNGWEKPQEGNFTYRFHLSLGATNELAKWMQDKARHKFQGGEQPGDMPKEAISRSKRNKNKRFSRSIDPADFSQAYKRYINSEYEDLNSMLEQAAAPKHLRIDRDSPFPMAFQLHEAEMYLFCSAFCSELDNNLLYNMVAVSAIFDQFMFDTFHANNHQGIARFEATNTLPLDGDGDVRAVINFGVAAETLEALDYDPGQCAHLARAFEEFFGNLEMDRVMLRPA